MTELAAAQAAYDLLASAGLKLNLQRGQPSDADFDLSNDLLGTYPGGTDPDNRNIRLAPTRPPVAEVRTAMQVTAACIRLATAEHRMLPG